MNRDLLQIYMRNHLSVFYLPILLVGIILWVRFYLHGYPDNHEIIWGVSLLAFSSIFFLINWLFYKRSLSKNLNNTPLITLITKSIIYKICYMGPWLIILFWPFKTDYMFDHILGFIFVFSAIGLYVAMSSSCFILFLTDIFIQLIAAGLILWANKNSIETTYIFYALFLFTLYALFIGKRLYETSLQLVKTNAKLVVAASEAKEANMAKSDFLSMISHEIRTPMHGIISTVEHLTESNLSTKQQESIGIISRCAETLLSMLNNILDVSKIEAKKIEIENVVFDISTLANDAIGIVKHSAEKKGIDLSLEIDANIPKNIVSDKGKIQQILLNLLSNSIKFTEKGLITLKIIYQKNDNIIRAEVTDTGIGISPDNQKKLFTRFSQADSSITRQYGGTGLGLFIAKDFLTLMGGKIGLESQLNSGSKFWFEIPCIISNAPPSKTNQNSDELNLPASLSILVAEDNDINQRSVERILLHQNANVKIVNNGEELLHVVGTQPFNIILMDMNMPVMDGIITTKKLKENADISISSIPVIGLTAATEEKSIQKFYDAGIIDHITKPFKKQDFIKIILKHIKSTHSNTNNELNLQDSILTKLEEIKEDFGDDFYFSFVHDSLTEIDRLVAGLKESYETDNLNNLYQYAHDLCAVSGNLGMENTQKIAKKLEINGLHKERDIITDIYKNFFNTIEPEIEYIKNLIKSIS